jgi:hypothetical protein
MARNNVCSKVVYKNWRDCNPRTYLTNLLIGVVLETLNLIKKVHPWTKI